MRGHNWKIRRQLFISFALLEFCLLIASVGGGVIKREAIEHTAVTDTEVPTENNTKTQVTSTELPTIESTPAVIARVTANDIKKQQGKRLEDSTTEVKSFIVPPTESLAELLQVENGTNHTTTKLIRAEASSSVKTTEDSLTATFTSVPAIKDVFNAGSTTDILPTSTQAVTIDETTLENERQTTTEEPYHDFINYTFNNDDSLSEKPKENYKLGNLQSTTIATPQSTYDPETTSQLQNVAEFSTTPEKKSDQEATTVRIDRSTTSKSSYREENTTILPNTSLAADSTNHDITTNEIKNITAAPTKRGDKRAKQMKDSNMTLPESPEVWALAGLKNVDSSKDITGKLINITVGDNDLSEVNSTTSTKLLTDWTQIMKEVEIRNNSINLSPNSIENTLESSNDKLGETKQNLGDKSEQENHLISITSSPSVNQTSTTSTPSRLSSTVQEEVVKTAPPIEKNQVEGIENDYSNKKKIKIKDNWRNSSAKEEHNNSVLSVTETITPEKVNTSSVKPSNGIAKLVQSTTLPTMASSNPATTTPTASVTEVNEISKRITSTSSLENLVDAPNLTTPAQGGRSTSFVNRTERIPTSTSENISNQIKITTDQHKSTSETVVATEAAFDPEETTLAESSTQTEDFVPSSSISSLSLTPEASSTETYEQYYSSSAFAIPSSTIVTQVKPATFSESSLTTTEEYSTTSPSTATEEDTSAAKIIISSTSERTTENNAIDKSTESTTDGFDQFTSETSKMSTTTFISLPPGFMNITDDISTTTTFQNTPTKSPHHFVEPTRSQVFPKVVEISTTEQPLATTTTNEPPAGGMVPPENNNMPNDTDYNVIIAISVSVVGIIALILLVGFLYVMRKRQKNLTYGQRCRPVSLDAYSLDNVSVYNSVRRKGAMRASKRSYGNAAFDDPSLKHNVLTVHDLSKFVDKKSTIYEEFQDVPQIIARPDEVPPGCEDKNRYANVIPLPETRVILQKVNDDEKTEYINANYVRGPKDPPNYYIACQAPLESTAADFWRMIWEQNSRVIIMATDLVENGKEKCAEYLPPSITIDNHVVFGDFQITLKNREVKDKYAVSTLHVKNTSTNSWREITHFWYQWPETGVPTDEAGVIAMLLEARSCLKIATQEQADEDDSKSNGNGPEANGNLDKSKSVSKTQGPLTVHCSPGTGRTGTIIACDIALRSLETPKRSVDIPQIVYYVRRGRASAVQTKDQYEFIYRLAHMYATKISGPIIET